MDIARIGAPESSRSARSLATELAQAAVEVDQLAVDRERHADGPEKMRRFLKYELDRYLRGASGW